MARSGSDNNPSIWEIEKQEGAKGMGGGGGEPQSLEAWIDRNSLLSGWFH